MTKIPTQKRKNATHEIRSRLSLGEDGELLGLWGQQAPEIGSVEDVGWHLGEQLQSKALLIDLFQTFHAFQDLEVLEEDIALDNSEDVIQI